MNNDDILCFFILFIHKKIIKTLYFNIPSHGSPNYNPYALECASRINVNKNVYCIASSNGIICKLHADCSEVEIVSISKWYRESVLFDVIKAIPFFQQFRIRKYFKRWIRYYRYNHFHKIILKMENRLLININYFYFSLITIKRYISQIETLKLFNFEMKNQTLEYYEQRQETIKNASYNTLTCTIKNINTILNFTVNEMKENLKKKGNLVMDKTFEFNTDSICKIAEYYHKRKADYKLAFHQLQLVPNYIKMVQLMISNTLQNVVVNNFFNFMQDFNAYTFNDSSTAKICLTFVYENDALQLPVSEKDVFNVFENIFKKRLHYMNSICLTEKMKNITSENFDNIFKNIEKSSNEIEKILIKYYNRNLLVQGKSYLDCDTTMNYEEIQLDSYDTYKISNYWQQLKKMIHEAFGEIRDLTNKYNYIFNNFYKTMNLYDDYYKKGDELKNDKKVKKYTAYQFEEFISDLHSLNMKISSVNELYNTNNKIFAINCKKVKKSTLKNIKNAHKKIEFKICNSVMQGIDEFNKLVKDCIEQIIVPTNTIYEYSSFVENIKKNQNLYKYINDEFKRIKSLFEVIKLSFRPCTENEEKIEINLTLTKNNFVTYLQNAIEKTNIESPLMLKYLGDETSLGNKTDKKGLIRKLMDDLNLIYEKSNNIKYVKITTDGRVAIEELMSLKQEYTKILDELKKVIDIRKLLSEKDTKIEGYLIFLDKICLRLELWFYKVHSESIIEKWKKMEIHKIDFSHIMSRIVVWISASTQISNYIDKGDEILRYWFQNLTAIKNQIQLLYSLVDKRFKKQHWRVLFLQFGLRYNENRSYCLQELLDLNLLNNEEIIKDIFYKVIINDKILQDINRIKIFWFEKHFSICIYNISVFVSESIKIGTSLSSDDLKVSEKMYILNDMDELASDIDDHTITIRTMKFTSSNKKITDSIGTWISNLNNLKNLLSMWHRTQTQWLYLLRGPYANFSSAVNKEKYNYSRFLDCHAIIEQIYRCKSIKNVFDFDFKKDFMNSSLNNLMKKIESNGHTVEIPECEDELRYVWDPQYNLKKSLSRNSMSRSRTMSDYKTCNTSVYFRYNYIIRIFEICENEFKNLIDENKIVLNEMRCQNPRLYFYSDNILKKLLTINTDNIANFSHYFGEIFPNVVEPIFCYARDGSVIEKNTTIDYIDSTKLLSVYLEKKIYMSGIIGTYGEKLNFDKPLSININEFDKNNVVSLVNFIQTFEHTLNVSFRHSIEKHLVWWYIKFTHQQKFDIEVYFKELIKFLSNEKVIYTETFSTTSSRGILINLNIILKKALKNTEYKTINLNKLIMTCSEFIRNLYNIINLKTLIRHLRSEYVLCISEQIYIQVLNFLNLINLHKNNCNFRNCFENLYYLYYSLPLKKCEIITNNKEIIMIKNLTANVGNVNKSYSYAYNSYSFQHFSQFVLPTNKCIFHLISAINSYYTIAIAQKYTYVLENISIFIGCTLYKYICGKDFSNIMNCIKGSLTCGSMVLLSNSENLTYDILYEISKMWDRYIYGNKPVKSTNLKRSKSFIFQKEKRREQSKNNGPISHSGKHYNKGKFSRFDVKDDAEIYPNLSKDRANIFDENEQSIVDQVIKTKNIDYFIYRDLIMPVRSLQFFYDGNSFISSSGASIFFGINEQKIELEKFGKLSHKMRSYGISTIDIRILCKIWLFSNTFIKVDYISEKICCFIFSVKAYVPYIKNNETIFMHTVIKDAFAYKYTVHSDDIDVIDILNSLCDEDYISHTIWTHMEKNHYFLNYDLPEDFKLVEIRKLNIILCLKKCFSLGINKTLVSICALREKKLRIAINYCLIQNDLHKDSNLINSMIQINQLLLHNNYVTICGPPGSGKTTAWKTLASAMTLINRDYNFTKANRLDDIKTHESFHRLLKNPIYILKNIRLKRHNRRPLLNKFKKYVTVIKLTTRLLKNQHERWTIREKFLYASYYPSVTYVMKNFNSDDQMSNIYHSIFTFFKSRDNSFFSTNSVHNRNKNQSSYGSGEDMVNMANQKWAIIDVNCDGLQLNRHIIDFFNSTTNNFISSEGNVSYIKDNHILIFETATSLKNETPSTISQSQMVYINGQEKFWLLKIKAWSYSMKQK
ncbi:hypothetical protein A3Q56_05275 [Intoshia linei]|uniref:Dynein heavy chain linker domain-containing protein n=1 Tax=Intoshia linei TaxID=1819745 RepID=A0A177B042_9BILA|nr:hypothetical protein A3Q56_05275 [Intoshia linei]